MLVVQEYLLTHTAAELRAEHGVKLRWSEKRPGVFTLNYDQIDVRDSDPLSQQCRGLILRSETWAAMIEAGHEPLLHLPIGATSIVARPFDRFFNHGEQACAPVDFGHARYYEKIDGTLCIVHFDHGEWHVGTRSTPDADVPIDGNELTFRALFERALPDGVKLGDGLNEGCTYMFELTAPENQVVVAYDRPQVWLLGVRGRDTGIEKSPDGYADIYPVCHHHELTLEEMLSWVAERDPSKHEGLVVCDHAFRRCKVKSPAYVALSHVRDSLGKSPRAMMTVVLSGREEEAKPLLPQYLRDMVDAMKRGLERELDRIDASYAALFPVDGDRKAFALAIQASAFPTDMAPHMQRFTGKCSDARSWVASHRSEEGTWTDSMLDMLVERAGRV